MTGPGGDHDGEGAVPCFYAANGLTLLPGHATPSARAMRGEEFDNERLWVGQDPTSLRALSVSARAVRGAGGELTGAVLALGLLQG